jgi:hypothetical protein
MPEQTFQYFVPVGSTSVSITAAFFGAGGVTLDIETTQQAVVTIVLLCYIFKMRMLKQSL